MNKIKLIITREYLVRVKKKSFIIMTFLAPLLMAAAMIIPALIATKTEGVKSIIVHDESMMYVARFNNSKSVKFIYRTEPLDSLKNIYKEEGAYAVLHIPKPDSSVPTQATLYSDKDVSVTISGYIKEQLKTQAEKLKLLTAGVSEETIKKAKSNVNLETKKWGEDGSIESSMPRLKFILGLLCGFLIYFFIFMFGSQVMRGVIEEKTNRIVEVIVSSVKPFQLMMGKVVGIALVGLTQFLLWIILTGGIYLIFMQTYGDTFMEQQTEMVNIQDNNELVPMNINDADKLVAENEIAFNIKNMVGMINIPYILGCLLFYFIFGYLAYAALFAAIGSAVDNETDTNQFMMPITIPLIIAIISSTMIANNPDGQVAFWLSMIPLTSPIAMMIRVPFSVPIWELALSMTLLILFFVFCTWLAGKIYRTGILMYGKKVTYKELWKWLKMKS